MSYAFNILSMINILSMVNKQVSLDGLGYKCNDQRGIFKSNFQHLSSSLGALSRENSTNLADRTTHCRAVDKIFVGCQFGCQRQPCWEPAPGIARGVRGHAPLEDFRVSKTHFEAS